MTAEARRAARLRRRLEEERGSVILHVRLPGLVVFSVALVTATALVTWALRPSASAAPGTMAARPTGASASAPQPVASPSWRDVPPPSVVAPWGELAVSDMDLEPPDEYIATETVSRDPETWTFPGRAVPAVRESLAAAGLGPKQVDDAVASARSDEAGTGTVLTPSDDVVVSLSSDVRASLYRELARSEENGYMQYPFRQWGEPFARRLDGRVDKDAVLLLETLLYRRGRETVFSDYPMVLRRLPTDDQKLAFIKALSRQSAVLARLRLRADSDIDKIASYWAQAPGVRSKDVRPLLESLKRVPGGGSLNVIYLMPPFARARLYTFPMPPKPGEIHLDCHWSTFNYFNETPDAKFAVPKNAGEYLAAHYYQIAEPTAHGDVIGVFDESGQVIHSCVHVADDLVFTKNGSNFLQPWILMHMKDMLALYGSDADPKYAVYRRNDG